MRKSTFLLLIAIIGSLLIATGVNGQEIEEYNIDITSITESISVVEIISIDILELAETFNFSIQDGASDISVTISDVSYEYTLIDDIINPISVC